MYIELLLLLPFLLYGIIRNIKGTIPSNSHFDPLNTNALKGILAVFVVIGHISTRCLLPSGYAWAVAFQSIGTSAVTIFFFLSGYGIMKSFMSKGLHYLDGFFMKRITKVFFPLAIATAIIPSLFSLLINNYPPKLYRIQSISSLVLSDWAYNFDQILHGYTFLPYSWFVFAILLFYLQFYIVATLFKTPFKIAIALLVMILIEIIIERMIMHWPAWWYESLISINIGAFVAIYEMKIITYYKKFATVTLLMSGLLSIILFYYANMVSMSGVGIILSIILPLVIYSLICIHNYPQYKGFQILGNYSFEIYLVQSLFLIVFLYIDNILLFFIISIIAIIIASIILKLLTNSLSKTVSRLFN